MAERKVCGRDLRAILKDDVAAMSTMRRWRNDLNPGARCGG
jgi:hypothetical protein